MENFKIDAKKYLELLRDRSKKSRVYKSYQMTGLMLAEILNDPSHKSLYMRLAKSYDAQKLIILAKGLADRPSIQNKGAYFMRMLQELKKQK